MKISLDKEFIIKDSIYDFIYDSIKDSVWNAVWDSVYNVVRNSVWATGRTGAIQDIFWDSIWAFSIRDPINDRMR